MSARTVWVSTETPHAGHCARCGRPLGHMAFGEAGALCWACHWGKDLTAFQAYEAEKAQIRAAFEAAGAGTK